MGGAKVNPVSQMSRTDALKPPTTSGVSQASLRTQNLALLAARAFASDTPLSRADLAEATGLTRSTVSRLVSELVSGGILEELAPHEGRRGRPAIPLAPAARSVVAIGLEVGARSLAGRLIDLTGTVLAEEVVSGRFEHSEPAPVLARLGELTRALVASAPCAGAVVVGATLALPGLVDHVDGRLLRAPNLEWSEVRPADLIGPGALPEGIRLGVRNEADLAALAHSRLAPARPAPTATFFYVSGDIGVGAATVVDGVISAGMRGWAGEIGHTLVDPAGPRCGCGARGCLEQYAGRDALLERAGLPPGTTARRLAEDADGGNDRARDAIERAGWALGIALANVVNILDVDEIVLGGDLVALFDLLRGPVEDQLRTRVLASPWSQVTLRAAGTDPYPAVTGGAFAALETVVASPADWIAAPA